MFDTIIIDESIIEMLPETSDEEKQLLRKEQFQSKSLAICCHTYNLTRQSGISQNKGYTSKKFSGEINFYTCIQSPEGDRWFSYTVHYIKGQILEINRSKSRI